MGQEQNLPQQKLQESEGLRKGAYFHCLRFQKKKKNLFCYEEAGLIKCPHIQGSRFFIYAI